MVEFTVHDESRSIVCRVSRECIEDNFGLFTALFTATGGDNYIETVWGRGYVLRDPPEANLPTGAEQENSQAQGSA